MRYEPGPLEKWLDTVKLNLYKHPDGSGDMDWLHVNVGIEGSGKSNTGAYMCYRVDQSITGKQVVYDYETLRNAVHVSKPCSTIMIDEGAEMLNSRQSMSGENIELVKMFARMREKHLFVVVNIPEIRILDVNLRAFRLRSLSRCRVKYNPRTQKITKGWTNFFSRAKALRIRPDASNKMIFPRATFSQKIPDMSKVAPDFWREYRELKKSFVDEKERLEKERLERKKQEKTRTELVKLSNAELTELLSLPIDQRAMFAVEKKYQLTKHGWAKEVTINV